MPILRDLKKIIANPVNWPAKCGVKNRLWCDVFALGQSPRNTHNLHPRARFLEIRRACVEVSIGCLGWARAVFDIWIPWLAVWTLEWSGESNGWAINRNIVGFVCSWGCRWVSNGRRLCDIYLGRDSNLHVATGNLSIYI